MKKFLLVAVAALAVVACKKDNNEEPQKPQEQEITADQSSIPTTVDFKYPKSTVVVNYSTVTVTYTVANKLLTGVKVENAPTSSSKEYKLHYNANKYLTAIEELTTSNTLKYSYNDKGQIVGVSGLFQGTTHSRTLEYNADGKLSKITIREGDDTYSDNHDITFDYSVANQIKVTDKDLQENEETILLYTLDAKGNILTKVSGENTTKYEEYDNKVNILSKSPFNFFDEYGNVRIYGDLEDTLHSTNNPGKETTTGNNPSVRTYQYDYDGDNVTKKSVTLSIPGQQSYTATTTYNY